jgi:hypothetical protein
MSFATSIDLRDSRLRTRKPPKFAPGILSLQEPGGKAVNLGKGNCNIGYSQNSARFSPDWAYLNTSSHAARIAENLRSTRHGILSIPRHSSAMQ